MSKNRKRQKSQNQNNRSVIIETMKDLMKEMMTPLDGKKVNWWLNGLAFIIMLLIFLGVMSYG